MNKYRIIIDFGYYEGESKAHAIEAAMSQKHELHKLTFHAVREEEIRRLPYSYEEYELDEEAREDREWQIDTAWKRHKEYCADDEYDYYDRYENQ